MSAQISSIESIFSAALEITSVSERAAYLNRACAGDAALRARVEVLLKADADAGSFLDKPPAALDATVDGTADGTDGNDTGAWPSDLSFLDPCDKPGRLGVLRGKSGEYEVMALVGRGGMGAVLRAVDTKLNRVVAVKVMAPELAANPTAVKRFLREAQAAAAVHHDHVVTIYAVDDEHRPPFLAMEFIEGETLSQKIEREGSLRLVQILRIGLQIAAGLAAAHKHGLIHRDVKPGNILLENGVERVKITDFGLARATDDLEMTQSGLIAGTPQYMSPEQAKGEVIDARSDLFSLGSVLYAMCTGRPAFRAETTLGVLRGVCDDAPPPISQTNPEIPLWLERIVGRLLAKDPAGRFQTAKEVADLLGQHLAKAQNPPRSLPPELAAATRWVRFTPLRAAIAAALVVLAAIAAGLGGYAFWLSTNFAIIAIEIDDPQVVVTFDGRVVPLSKASGKTTAAEESYLKLQAERSPLTVGSSVWKGWVVRRVQPGPHQIKAVRRGDVIYNETVQVGPGATRQIVIAIQGDTIGPGAGLSSGVIGAGSPRVASAPATSFPHGSSADILTSGDWEWTEPENLGPVVNSSYHDGTPYVTTDGLTLYFCSGRPGGRGGQDIWMTTRTASDQAWATPVNLGTPINSPAGEHDPCLSFNGLSLVWARRYGTKGELWGATRASQDHPFRSPSPLMIDGSLYSAIDPWLSSDGRTILFAANRPGGHGHMDVWQSRRGAAAEAWKKPENLGPDVNSPLDDLGPCLASDGLAVLFATAGNSSDLVACTRQSNTEPWSPRFSLGSVVNSDLAEFSPCLSSDNETLYFSSHREGGEGDRDLWMSRRVRKKVAD